MVFKNIRRIKTALPDVLHIVMFYNNGTIFQTTFDQSLNIPKLGENLAEILSHVRKVYELCNFRADSYRKLIFETDDISVIVIKLGEDSNLALFFKTEVSKDIKLRSIRRYIKKIEKFMDMDQIGLMFQDLELNELELKTAQTTLQSKQEEINKRQNKLEKEADKLSEKDKKDLLNEIDFMNKEYSKLQEDILQRENNIKTIVSKIEEEKKKIEGEKKRSDDTA